MGGNFRYAVDVEAENYMVNWLADADVMCADPAVLKSVASSYYLGFAFGLTLFPMPDIMGRKRTLNIIMISFIIASAMSLYA